MVYYITSYITSDGSIEYGVIQSFLIHRGTSISLIKTYNVVGTSPISHLRPARDMSIRKQNVDNQLRSIFVSVAQPTSMVAVPTVNLKKKCISIPVKKKNYIVPFPNQYEIH